MMGRHGVPQGRCYTGDRGCWPEIGVYFLGYRPNAEAPDNGTSLLRHGGHGAERCLVGARTACQIPHGTASVSPASNASGADVPGDS